MITNKLHPWAEDEAKRYAVCYRSEHYHCGLARLSQADRVLAETQGCSLLDVGCGRGEVMLKAAALGYDPIAGTEIVPALCERACVTRATADALPWPDQAWDVVTCLDVLEHVPDHAVEATLQELARVCGERLIVTVSNLHDHAGEFYGVGPLHITLKAYDEWYCLMCRAWPDFSVEWRNSDSNGGISELFVADRRTA
jgi:2-polyprenyl-3-methyl-5-hydroxy-6-metoxy-1,4-benzoquinol methylase